MVVAVSGGFDPLHKGHIRYLEDAKKLSGKDGTLIVILNGDSFLIRKKGYVFFNVEERQEIVSALRCVDEVYIYESEKDDVCEALIEINPDIFAKGGDRRPDGDPIPEEELCGQLGIKVVYGVGGNDKPNSSSWVVDNVWKQIEKKNTIKNAGPVDNDNYISGYYDVLLNEDK